MSARECSRCGRVQPSWESNEAVPLPPEMGGPADGGLSNLLGDAWTSVDRKVLCPDCQTLLQRENRAGPIISSIQDWINGNDDVNAPPSGLEAILIPYVMGLRQAQSSERELVPALGTPAPNDSPDPDPHPLPQPRRTKLQVAVTGAFLTGCPLRIGMDEYPKVQREIAHKLQQISDRGWKEASDNERVGTYRSGGGFTSMLPLVVARMEGAGTLAWARAFLDTSPGWEQDWFDRPTNDWKVSPRSMRIEIYDLGVAVINGTFDIRVPAELNLTAAASAVKRLVWLRADGDKGVNSPVAGMFRQLSLETTRQFRAGVAATVPHRVQRLWLPPAPTTTTTPSDWGRLLWLHPVHMLETEDAKKRIVNAKALAPTFSKIVAVEGGQFVAGIGWSAIVTDRDKSARDVPMQLLQLQWAYIALYMEIDRGLLAVLNRNDSATTATVLSTLEKQAADTFADYIRVMEARARVDSALASLGGDEQAVWDVIADVTKFDALVGGVDRKVEVLQRLADRRVQQATAASTRRSTRILGFLTTLTFVTLSVTLLAFFVGGLSDESDDIHLSLRWGVLFVGVLVAVIIWFVTFGWPKRNKRPDTEHFQAWISLRRGLRMMSATVTTSIGVRCTTSTPLRISSARCMRDAG